MKLRLFHRHTDKLLGIYNHPDCPISWFLFQCTTCYRIRDEDHGGHWCMGTDSDTDNEFLKSCHIAVPKKPPQKERWDRWP